MTWGVTFPVFDKVKVNGGKAAPLYKALKKTRDAEGKDGPVIWNFEKFVLTPDGDVHRFRPQTSSPDDPAIVAGHRARTCPAEPSGRLRLTFAVSCGARPTPDARSARRPRRAVRPRRRTCRR